ncbi:Dyp-type peroxidase [Nocardioides insulae]|uniref:Dyp-type peroxidase n=1 Tax=Nocardioides insulae TaxID=394734 RepID=UPI0003F62A16|nr:Dyp-type peroxidase [Nocardioides insulae]
MSSSPRRWGRRQVLQSSAAALGGAGLGWSAAAGLLPAPAAAEETTGAPATTTVPSPGNETVSFHAAHQAGIATPPQATLTLIGLDLRDGVTKPDLGRMLSLLSDDAARLTRGLPALADTEPELAEHPARLSVTFGFGPRVMDQLLGGRVGGLKALPDFKTDRLDPAWGQTDLAVQICAEDPLTLAHARRMILKDSADFATVRWLQEGYRYAHGTVPDGTTMRNVMGQVDGTVNPVEADPDFASLVWSQQAGFEGGTFMVVRRMRTELDTWDKVDRPGREATIGRTLDNGAPLTGTSEHDEPDFEATDDLGFPVIDPASHVARARSEDPAQRFHRRSYNYTVPDPSRPTGEDSGLVFIAFAADLERQFVPVQARLAELDRLNEWVTTIGSAVYAIPPGAAEDEYVGQGLVER